MPLLLSETDVSELITMPDLIAAMDTRPRRVFRRRRGAAGADRRRYRRSSRVFRIDAGVCLVDARAGRETGDRVSFESRARIAVASGDHLLFDPETGALQAILDGRYITEARTAAVSAVSVRKLARAYSRVLAILGSGVQARSHFEALAHVADSTKCARGARRARIWKRFHG